ncbi:Alkali-sensitive linkage protein 1-like protein 1 [Colletotrichum musicola]|uniref:Alkali-sensitive linkage protein 1-like protein 1 n=1 Tax=Colletotrichum musicola TaxID=2175873 RepID=A0A8H6K4E5_9PEZI|nr:Alkali-sensitive linkage protein 1-like protein 1 [Colletotrichum musicola]
MRRTSHALLAILAASAAVALSDLPSKRGLAYRGDDHQGDNQLLTSGNSLISWYYTWSTWPAQSLNDSHLVFVPLIHGIDNAEDDELRNRLDRLPDSATHLLTFNEPDGTTDSGGSSIEPEDAAKAYVEHILPLRDSGSRRWNISHPVVTGSPMGMNWLRKFNESCYELDDGGCPADFVAVHWYGNALGLQNWLGDLRNFYEDVAPGLEFWITEMALAQESLEATLAMMNESLTFLDDAEDVGGYAWFGAFREDEANEWTGDAVSLFDDDGGLTELGALYLGGEEQGFKKGQKGEGNFAASLSPAQQLLWTAILAAVGAAL